MAFDSKIYFCSFMLKSMNNILIFMFNTIKSMLFDGIFLIAMVITGIVCAVRESQIPWFDYDFVFRRGAYSIAAVTNST